MKTYIVKEYQNGKWINISEEVESLSLAKDDFDWLKDFVEGEIKIFKITTTFNQTANIVNVKERAI